MIRSEVGVTLPALPLALTECVPESERSVLTTCFEPSLAVRDAFCFFVIGLPFGNGRTDCDTYHIEAGCTMPILRCIEEVLPAFREASVR